MAGSDGDGRATVFAVYRVGDVDEDMTRALRCVLEAHQERCGCSPVEVVVNKTLISKARAALDGLGMVDLPVSGCGGCLTWEVWLGTAGNGAGPADGDAMALGNQSDSEGLRLLGDDRRPASLVRRVEAARREGGRMTPERAQERLRQLGLFEFEEVTR